MRLYYTDSYLRQFSARVLESFEVSEQPAVILDQTAFYPTSGGQPHDTGMLGSVRVVDVTVREADQAVVHRLDAPLANGPVEGSIDWTRRFDHMQQHTGQHILSQAFIEAADAETIGFHLGAESVSIDLNAQMEDADIVRAGDIANAVVTSNLVVRAWFPDPGELAGLPLRKRPEVVGPVRVVGIGDFDYSACGGTHVAATGEVGLIAMLRSERLKRGTRIEFLCGDRARRDYAAKHAVLRELAGTFTCAIDELPEAITRAREALQEARRGLAAYREQELDREAADRLDAARTHGALRILHEAWENRPMEEVRGLATRITAGPGVVALFGVAGSKTQLLFARSEQVPLDLAPTFRAALESLGGGKGGGTRLLQGTAGPANRTELEELLRTTAERITAT
jgi:alanyl-tRNA synthetase